MDRGAAFSVELGFRKYGGDCGSGSGEAGPRQPRDMTSLDAPDIAPAPSAPLRHQSMFCDRRSIQFTHGRVRPRR